MWPRPSYLNGSLWGAFFNLVPAPDEGLAARKWREECSRVDGAVSPRADATREATQERCWFGRAKSREQQEGTNEAENRGLPRSHSHIC